MNITNPTNFGIPGLTLTTANAEGTGNAIRTGASILAFDATDPAAVAASAVVGTATVSARRDHVHPGIVGAGTVVDNAIARFDGTSGDSLQGYSSLSPTISDAGVITLASGNLVFPATATASAGNNSLSDYEQGTWAPILEDNDHSDKSQAANQQAGTYTKIGNRVILSGHVRMSSLGTLTTTDTAYIGNLPFVSNTTANLYHSLAPSNTDGFDSVSAGDEVQASVYNNNDFVTQRLGDTAGGSSGMTIAEFSADGNITLTGSYNV